MTLHPLADIVCEDCGAVVRSLWWMPPKTCRCGAMTVHKGIAKYRPIGTPAKPKEPKGVDATRDVLSFDCVDEAGVTHTRWYRSPSDELSVWARSDPHTPRPW